MRLEVQQSIMNKAFRENKTPFTQDGDVFSWTGMTKVKSKKTLNVYTVDIALTLTASPRLANQVSACLMKPEGIRMEDLIVTGMIDPKFRGSIEMNGLPQDKIEKDLSKFIKKLNKSTE